MATLIGKFVNSTWSSSSNWTDRATGSPATPADGDELELVSASGVASITGSDETAIDIISLTVGKAFNIPIATSGARLQLSCPRINYNGRSESAWLSLRTFAYTDIVIDGSDNKVISSSAQPFTDAHVGLKIKITGGTGFTTGTYEVLSVNSGNATLDSAVGTVGSTGGTGHFQISLTVKGTATIDADEITTKGLHLKCIGNADLLDPKFDSGYIQIEVESGSGTTVGTFTSTATLLHNYMTLNNLTAIKLGGSGESSFVNWKPSSSGPTVTIATGGVWDQYQTSLTVPASGPNFVTSGGTLRWFATALLGDVTGDEGSLDFSEATVPFQIDGVCLVRNASLKINNGLKTPTFAGGLQFRGASPDWQIDGNINVAVTYVK